MSISVSFEAGNVSPRIVRIVTSSTLAQVTAAGWYKNVPPNQLVPSDNVEIAYAQGSSSAATSIFDVAISAAGVVTLSLAESNVILPVVSGDFANFSGTSGAIADLGYLPSDAAKTKVVMAGSAVVLNNIAHFVDTSGTIDDTAANVTNMGNIYAGASGTAGVLRSYPATVTTGYLGLTGVANGGDYAIQIANVSHGQASIHSLPDPGNAAARILVAATATPFVSGNLPAASGTGGLMVDSGVVANRVLYTSFASPDAAADLVSFDVTVGFAALATGGSVTLVASSGAKQYKIRELWLNSGGTNFSGGGGDRLGQVTDGTTAYSVIPAAIMQALVNAGWGITTSLPFPAAAAINTSSAAGANIVFQYSGGTTDYTAGSLVISGIAQRVA